jgi:hypothetical protein
LRLFVEGISFAWAVFAVFAAVKSPSMI